jgi:threonylcarbamoyladenosine tRNA methylthiotransferase MtaB
MNQYKKVSFYTLGCKLNFSETSTIARQLKEAGYAQVNFDESADVCVINTCSVTENADKKCKQLVKKAIKNNPDVFITIIGCYAQLKPEEITKIPGVNLVLGANEKFNIVEHLEKMDSEQSIISTGKIKEVNDFHPSYSVGDRTRSFLKIQDGCDYFCSFCTIPLARGKSRSNTIEKTIASAKEVAKTDVKEIVLTGVNIGDFGVGNDENFFQLVQELDKMEDIDRIRISSIEPNLLSNDIIEFVSKSKRFVPHFHIPLQSGSNTMLKAMRRKYLSELYTDRVNTIQSLMPDCCIGVDVIVGFPGETEEEFLITYNYLKDLPVSYLHVFTYSERANTTAKKMPNSIPIKERQKRSAMLRILSDKKRRAFYETQINKTKKVLFEEENNDGFIHGFTENYVKIKYPFSTELRNTICSISLDNIDRDGSVKASLISQEQTI